MSETEHERWKRLAEHCQQHGSRMAWGNARLAFREERPDPVALEEERGWMDGYEGKEPQQQDGPYLDGYFGGVWNRAPMPKDGNY